MVTISLKSSIIISSWVQLALSHCPLNFLQIRFEMKTSLWKFIIATALGKLLFDQFSNVYDVWEYRYGLLPPWPSMSAVSPSLPWRLLSVESWQTTENLHFTQLSTHCHGSALWKHWSVGGCHVRLVNMLSCYVRVGNRGNLGTMRIRNFAPFLLITYSIQSVMHCIIFCPGECIEVTLLWDSSRSLSHWITFLYPKAAPKRNKKTEGVSECPPRHRSTNYLATDFPPPPTS